MADSFVWIFPSPDLATPGLLSPDTLAGPIAVLLLGWDEGAAVDFLLSPSLGPVDNIGGGEGTEELTPPSVEGDVAGDEAGLGLDTRPGSDIWDARS